jgi:DNA-directed RNA polymerase beta subunit
VTTRASWSRACSSTSAATTSVASGATSSTRSSTRRGPLGVELPRESRTITREDIAAIVGHLIECNRGLHPKDDIDHLGNRRIRANGELIQNAFRIGLLRMERVVRERMTIQEIDKATPERPHQHPARSWRR